MHVSLGELGPGWMDGLAARSLRLLFSQTDIFGFWVVYIRVMNKFILVYERTGHPQKYEKTLFHESVCHSIGDNV
jgi:hypothetical protein